MIKMRFRNLLNEMFLMDLKRLRIFKTRSSSHKIPVNGLPVKEDL